MSSCFVTLYSLTPATFVIRGAMEMLCVAVWIWSAFQSLHTEAQPVWHLSTSTLSMYYLHIDWLSFSEAICYCRSIGGSLIKLETEMELQYIAGWLQNLSLYSTWAGASDLRDEGQFVWLDGSPVLVDLFAEGEPNNMENKEHVVMIDAANMMLNDAIIDVYSYPLCEKSLSVSASSRSWRKRSTGLIYLDYLMDIHHDVLRLFDCLGRCMFSCRCVGVTFQPNQTCYLYHTYFARIASNSDTMPCDECESFD